MDEAVRREADTVPLHRPMRALHLLEHPCRLPEGRPQRVLRVHHHGVASVQYAAVAVHALQPVVHLESLRPLVDVEDAEDREPGPYLRGGRHERRGQSTRREPLRGRQRVEGDDPLEEKGIEGLPLLPDREWKDLGATRDPFGIPARAPAGGAEAVRHRAILLIVLHLVAQRSIREHQQPAEMERTRRSHHGRGGIDIRQADGRADL
mmetsp:Transcript_37422/g.116565  ORF Transcript_37422/g.116565 Transcript_37422/m.116565 type:complete len:207 (-) Transcript_37422:6-626(-)